VLNVFNGVAFSFSKAKSSNGIFLKFVSFNGTDLIFPLFKYFFCLVHRPEHKLHIHLHRYKKFTKLVLYRRDYHFEASTGV
jgi:hypothetical protein